MGHKQKDGRVLWKNRPTAGLHVKTPAQHGHDLKKRNACLCASANGEMWPLQREVVAEVIMEQQCD